MRERRSTTSAPARGSRRREETTAKLDQLLESWRPVLDALGTNVFIADLELTLVFANRRATTTVQQLDGQLRTSFSVGAADVVGGSIHRFHQDPGRVERILAEDGFALPHDTTFRFGDAVLQTTIDAVVAPDGTKIGYVVAWEEISRLEEYRTGVGQLLESFETAAAAVEELSTSVGEIAESTHRVADATRTGVEEAELASAAVQELGSASEDIGDIVGTISGVAEQTNLLALNATIEAARAGDAGKGFAVVADEVKQLARSTGQATEAIEERIASLQTTVEQVIAALERITERLNEVDQLQGGVAATAEEQRTATGQLSQSVNEAASDGRELLGAT